MAKIEYINISYAEYDKLSYEEKRNSYCIEYLLEKCKDWKVNSELHREDGPAIEYGPTVYSNKNKFWYLNDIEYSFEEWLEKTPLSDEEKILLKLKYS